MDPSKILNTIERYGTMGCDFYKENPHLALAAGPAGAPIASACGLLDTYKNWRNNQRAAKSTVAPPVKIPKPQAKKPPLMGKMAQAIKKKKKRK